jgi:hypothetical protein
VGNEGKCKYVRLDEKPTALPRATGRRIDVAGLRRIPEGIVSEGI